jgi:hypothetical protein
LFLEPDLAVDFKKIFLNYQNGWEIIPTLFKENIRTDSGKKIFFEKLSLILIEHFVENDNYKGPPISLQKALNLVLRDSFHPDVYKHFLEYIPGTKLESFLSPTIYMPETTPSVEESIRTVFSELKKIKAKPKDEDEFYLFCQKALRPEVSKTVVLKILNHFKTQQIIKLGKNGAIQFAPGALAPSPEETMEILLGKFGLRNLPKTRKDLTPALKTMLKPGDYTKKLNDDLVKIMVYRGLMKKSPVRKQAVSSDVRPIEEFNPLFNVK